jgi:hypothetical protein
MPDLLTTILRIMPLSCGAAGMAFVVAMLPDLARADPQIARLSADVEARAAGALAVLGLAAVPSETASTLAFSSASDGNFRSSQFGGGPGCAQTQHRGDLWR